MGGVAQAGSPLTPTEQQWIAAGQPVMAYARQTGLPVDIIVQPTVHPDISPLSMAFIDGRCKLVLTMRGNPMVQEHLAGVPEALQSIVIEAMTAHEIGHCWRHAQGEWRALPAGFSRARPLDDRRDAQDQRREEGYADLVSLAWTLSRHPEHYAQVHAWLSSERGEANAPGLAHDTAAWVSLARDPGSFRAAPNVFEQALPLWGEGLRADE